MHRAHRVAELAIWGNVNVSRQSKLSVARAALAPMRDLACHVAELVIARDAWSIDFHQSLVGDSRDALVAHDCTSPGIGHASTGTSSAISSSIQSTPRRFAR